MGYILWLGLLLINNLLSLSCTRPQSSSLNQDSSFSKEGPRENRPNYPNYGQQRNSTNEQKEAFRQKFHLQKVQVQQQHWREDRKKTIPPENLSNSNVEKQQILLGPKETEQNQKENTTQQYFKETRTPIRPIKNRTNDANINKEPATIAQNISLEDLINRLLQTLETEIPTFGKKTTKEDVSAFLLGQKRCRQKAKASNPCLNGYHQNYFGFYKDTKERLLGKYNINYGGSCVNIVFSFLEKTARESGYFFLLNPPLTRHLYSLSVLKNKTSLSEQQQKLKWLSYLQQKKYYNPGLKGLYCMFSIVRNAPQPGDLLIEKGHMAILSKVDKNKKLRFHHALNWKDGLGAHDLYRNKTAREHQMRGSFFLRFTPFILKISEKISFPKSPKGNDIASYYKQIDNLCFINEKQKQK